MKILRAICFAVVAAAVSAAVGAHAEGQTYLYANSSDVQTPGHPIVLAYETGADVTKPIQVAVYRLPERFYLDRILNRRENLEERDVRGFPLVAHGHSFPPKKDQGWNRAVAVDALPVGAYAAVAKVDDGVAD